MKTEFVDYHNCRALGPNTKIIRAMKLDRDQEFVLGYQKKCPFCSTTAGEFEPGPGVMKNPQGEGWLVDTTKAERVHAPD